MNPLLLTASLTGRIQFFLKLLLWLFPLLTAYEADRLLSVHPPFVAASEGIACGCTRVPPEMVGYEPEANESPTLYCNCRVGRDGGSPQEEVPTCGAPSVDETSLPHARPPNQLRN